jgi:hypothetical protein
MLSVQDRYLPGWMELPVLLVECLTAAGCKPLVFEYSSLVFVPMDDPPYGTYEVVQRQACPYNNLMRAAEEDWQCDHLR